MKKRMLEIIIGVTVGGMVSQIINKRRQSKKNKESLAKIYKFQGYYNILNQWLKYKQQGKNLSTYFLGNGYRTIAIYGMGELGLRLYNELKDTEIGVKYVVDKENITDVIDVKRVGLDGEFAEVDVMVVTATFAFEEVKEIIGNKVKFPIISLMDVVYY